MPPEEGRMDGLTKFCLWGGIVLVISASGIPNYILVSLGLANRMPWTSGHRDVMFVGLCFIVGALAYWRGHSQGLRDGRWSQDYWKEHRSVHLPDPTPPTPPTGAPSLASEPTATFGPVKRETLRQAVESGDLDAFRRLLAADPLALNAKEPPHGWTLLHELSGRGTDALPIHARMADELIRAGADVNCRTVLGWTPIHMIAMQGQKEECELAKVLIAHGADVNATANDGSDWRTFWQHGNEIGKILSAHSVERRARR